MKFSTVAFAATLAVVASAQADEFPKCGLSCLANNIHATTDCELTDFVCSCSSDAFIKAATACINTQCEKADQQKAQTAAVGLCKSAGVDISPPTDDTPQTTAAPSTTPVPSAKPSGNTTTVKGAITPPIESQPPTSGSSRVAVAISVVGIGLLAAFSL